MRILVDHHSSGGQFALIEQWAHEGFSPPLHVHAHEDQLIYVIEGSVTAEVGGVRSTIAAGGSAWLPRGVPHTFRVDAAPMRLLEITTPAGFEQFHVAAGQPASELRIPDPAEPDIPAMIAASAHYDVSIIGPPMHD